MFYKNYLFFILILTTIIYLLIFVVNYDFKSKDNYFNAILTSSFNLTTRKNVTLFCFVKTHPENFNTRLIVSYENCIKYCTDYR